MTSLEIVRKKNIERNKELLKKLNIDTLSDLAPARSVNKSNKKAKPRTKTKVDKAVPIRRSKRLSKDPEYDREKQEEEERAEDDRLAQEKLRELRLSKITGDFDIKDLLADPKLGVLLQESLILKSSPYNDALTNEQAETHLQDSKAHVELSALRGFSTKTRTNGDTRTVKGGNFRPNCLDEFGDFSRASLHSVTDPSKTKLTPQRITSLLLHPSIIDRLAFAGDTNGNMGIWAIDQKSEADDPVVVVTKPHGRTISRISDVPNKQTHILTGSYDGSCKSFDLSKERVLDTLSIRDEFEGFLGISDINCPSDNMLYVTTLNGLFFRHDMRQHPKEARYKSLVRLHDKKIGGFCVNPLSEYHIATASLDRSIKIWDLRGGKHSNTSDGLSSLHTCGEYNSRLSVSSVDWNSNQRLVCNGYDDTIRLFDILNRSNADGGSARKPNLRLPMDGENLTAQHVLKHNCQTGRWLSILKSRWQKEPQDSVQKFAIGNMRRSINIYSEDGAPIANLAAPDIMTAVPAVVTLHPSRNWVLGGTSSGKVFLFN